MRISTVSGLARKLVLFGLVLLLPIPLASGLPQAGRSDPTFNPGDFSTGGEGFDHAPRALAAGLNGTIVAAGLFTRYNNAPAPAIIRIQPSGAADSYFQPGTGATNTNGNRGQIDNVVVLPNDKLLIAGYFDRYNGQPVRGVARLNFNGSLDPTFNLAPEVSGGFHTLAVQPDGKILLGGSVVVQGFLRGIARLNPDGSLDTSFSGSVLQGTVVHIQQLGDGRLLLAGPFLDYNQVAAADTLVRVLPNGQLDPSFQCSVTGIGGSGTWTTVYKSIVQPDGRILICGNFTTVNGQHRPYFARLNADGSTDSSFAIGTGPNSHVLDIALAANGDIYTCGEYTTFSGANRFCSKISSTGQVDAAFAAAFTTNARVSKIHLQSNYLYAAGEFSRAVAANNIHPYHVYRFGAFSLGGHYLPNFNPGTGANGEVDALTELTDGSIIAAGFFSRLNTSDAYNVARLRPNGTLDESFLLRAMTNDRVRALARTQDGRFYMGGDFTYAGGTPNSHLARVDASGFVDTSFQVGQGPSSIIYSLATQGDGKVYAGGSFATWNGVQSQGLARINVDGSLDTSFPVGSGFSSIVYDLESLPDGRVIAVGPFTSYQGQICMRIVRLLPNGQRDPSFQNGTGPNGQINAVTSLPDGRLAIAGSFTSYNGVLAARVAVLLPDGQLDTSFRFVDSLSYPLVSIAAQADGKVIIGGGFTSLGAYAVNSIARLHTNGTIDTGFQPSGGATNLSGGFPAVHSMVPTRDGRLVIGGWFTRYDGAPRHGLARAFLDTTAATFCAAGLGTGPCPCGNEGSPGHGCGNSVNPAGGLLNANGVASLASDTLVLHASGMPSSSALYFQGTSTPASGGMVFGDGLYCISGTLIRLDATQNLAGASSFPRAGTLSLSSQGQITAPGMRYYQVWYRNAANFCTPAANNLTNGMAVMWTP